MVSINAQAKLVRQLYEQGMRGLCIQVSDPPATRQLLEWLRARGVVVVTMVQPVDSSITFDHCGWSERDVGSRMADALAKSLPQGGHVALLTPPAETIPDNGPLAERYQGLKERLADYPAITILHEYACESPTVARKHICDSLRQFPTLAGWVSITNEPVRGGADPSSKLLSTLGQEDGRVLVIPEPLPDTWPAFDAGVRIVAVCPDYGSIAPQAIAIARTMLLRAGSFRDRGEIPLNVVNGPDFESFRQDWRRWCGDSSKP